jgi:ADP-ribose pyrophosphatase YjhB (NUDIX family)
MPEEAKRESNEPEEGVILSPPVTQATVQPAASTAGQSLLEGTRNLARDFVNALAISDNGEAMIFEQGKHGDRMISWHVVGGLVENGEDPMTAVKRSLRETAGYGSDEWLYLGSYMMAEADQQLGVGHFFCARGAQPVGKPSKNAQDDLELRWVSQRDLRYALLDGRVSVLSYAITISMALLTVLD